MLEFEHQVEDALAELLADIQDELLLLSKLAAKGAKRKLALKALSNPASDSSSKD